MLEKKQKKINLAFIRYVTVIKVLLYLEKKILLIHHLKFSRWYSLSMEEGGNKMGNITKSECTADGFLYETKRLQLFSWFKTPNTSVRG